MASLHWCAGSSCLQVIFSTNKADTIFSGMAMLHEYDASIPCEITGTPPSHIYKSRQVVWLNSHVCPKSIYLQDPRPFFRKNNDCSLFKNRSYKTTPVFNFTRFVLCSFCSLLILLFFYLFQKSCYQEVLRNTSAGSEFLFLFFCLARNLWFWFFPKNKPRVL